MRGVPVKYHDIFAIPLRRASIRLRLGQPWSRLPITDHYSCQRGVGRGGGLGRGRGVGVGLGAAVGVEVGVAVGVGDGVGEANCAQYLPPVFRLLSKSSCPPQTIRALRTSVFSGKSSRVLRQGRTRAMSQSKSNRQRSRKGRE